MRLQEYLDRSKITAAALARRLGTSHTTVRRWADGSISPSLEAMRKLHQVTDGQVSPNDFLAGEPVVVREAGAPQVAA